MCYTKAMKRNDPTFKEMVSRITSGELTRLQAADTYQIKPNTLNAWLRRSKIDAPKQTRIAYGAAADLMARLDPNIAKLLDEATQRVLDGTFKSCLEAQKSYPDVSLSTLTVRVRKARIAKGLPIGRQGWPKPPEAPVKALPGTPEEVNERLGFPVSLR